MKKIKALIRLANGDGMPMPRWDQAAYIVSEHFAAHYASPPGDPRRRDRSPYYRSRRWTLTHIKSGYAVTSADSLKILIEIAFPLEQVLDSPRYWDFHTVAQWHELRGSTPVATRCRALLYGYGMPNYL